MKRIANLLIWSGALVGVADAVAMTMHLGVSGAPWFVNLALVKLTFVAAAGLMSAGAVVGRLASREEARRLLPPNHEPPRPS